MNVHSDPDDDFEEKPFEEIIARVNQSFIEIFVNLGLKNGRLEKSLLVPLIECHNRDQTDISSLGLSVAKVLAINDPFVWSKIRVKQSEQCFKKFDNFNNEFQ